MKGNAQIDHVHGILCQDIGNGPAASLVYLAEFRDLILNVGFVPDLSEAGYIFSRRIIGTALASGSGIFMKNRTFIQIRSIVLFVDTGIVGVKAGAHIGRQHLGIR